MAYKNGEFDYYYQFLTSPEGQDFLRGWALDNPPQRHPSSKRHLRLPPLPDQISQRHQKDIFHAWMLGTTKQQIMAALKDLAIPGLLKDYRTLQNRLRFWNFPHLLSTRSKFQTDLDNFIVARAAEQVCLNPQLIRILLHNSATQAPTSLSNSDFLVRLAAFIVNRRGTPTLPSQ